MSTTEELLADQKRIAELLTNFISNTRAKAVADFTVEDYQSRLELLERYWNKFDENNETLSHDAKNIKDRSYVLKDVFMNTLLTYVDAHGWLNKNINLKLSATPTTSSAATTVMAQSAPSSSRGYLEKLKLQHFDGNQADWELFKETFMSTVILDKDPNFTSALKFQHLLACLSGEARDQLKGIQVIGPNFATAWETLCTRYDNRFVRFSYQMQALMNLPTATQESVAHINKLLNVTNESKNIFAALDRPVAYWDDFFVYFIVIKLDPHTRMDWEKEVEKKSEESNSDDFPKYSTLKGFLEKRLQILGRLDASSGGSHASTNLESS